MIKTRINHEARESASMGERSWRRRRRRRRMKERGTRRTIVKDKTFRQ